MALIICKECGMKISDQATSCPHCGCPIADVQNVQQVEIASVNLKPKNTKKILTFAGAAVALIAIIVLIFFANKSQNLQKQKEEFLSNAATILDDGLSGAVECETVCNLVKKVWSNTIYEESDEETDLYTKNSSGDFNNDFNTSLTLLFGSDDYTNSVALIKSYEQTLRESLSQMKVSTEDLQKCYDAAENLCKAYYDFTGLASSPTGSLNTFSESFSSIDSEIMSYYKDLKYELEKLENAKNSK